MKLQKLITKIVAPIMLALMFALMPAVDIAVSWQDAPSIEISIEQGATVFAEGEADAAALAAEGSSTGQQSLNQVMLLFSNMLSLVLQAMYLFVWPILAMIGMLMDNSLIFGTGMEERLLEVWQQIRNLINIAAVLGLVGLALYNVVAIDTDGNYTLKKILPRFVLALILVNFSFFGVKLVIDAANVVTAAMFTLPNTVELSTTKIDIDELGTKLCGVASNVNGAQTGTATSGQTLQATVSVATEALCSGPNTLSIKAKTLFQQFSQTNMAFLMAVQFGQIDKLLDASDLVRRNPSISSLSINMILSIAYYAIYIAGYIALLMVLIARIVVLWASVALAPLLALSFALPSGVGTDSLGKLKDEFLKHLIAPIKIGFAMSLGYIMLSAIQQVGPDSQRFQIADQFLAPFSGISSVQEFIAAAGSVGVLWMAIKSASDGTLVGRYVDGVFDWVKDKGEFLSKTPLYIPLPMGINSGGSSLAKSFGDLDQGFSKVRRNKNITTFFDKDPTPTASSKAKAAGLTSYVNTNFRTRTKPEALRVISSLHDRDTRTSTKVTNSEFINLLNTAGLDGDAEKDHKEIFDKLSASGNKSLKDFTGSDRTKLEDMIGKLVGSNEIKKFQKEITKKDEDKDEDTDKTQ